MGDDLLREPDYRQILDWAAALGKAPEWVLEQLEDSRLEPESWADHKIDPIVFIVEDGAITSLVWDFECLPQVPEDWQDGLLICTLGLKGIWPDSDKVLRPCMSHLQRLYCLDLSELAILDLTQTPRLTTLDCSGNHLTVLDLSPMPELTMLQCSRNDLTVLDLSPVSRLTMLGCRDSNQLTALDLAPVSGLSALGCSGNHLTELNLSPVLGLTRLQRQPAHRAGPLDGAEAELAFRG